MKKKHTEARVFALKGFTIKTDAGKFFVSPTGLNRWAGLYKSLHHATTAIARAHGTRRVAPDAGLRLCPRQH